MKKIFFLASLCILSTGAGLFFYPQLRQYLPFYGQLRTTAILLLRNPLCSYSDASRNLPLIYCPLYKFKMIYTKTTLLEKDSNGYEHWETPKGLFWTPSMTKKDNLAYTLAEIDCDIYGRPEQAGVHSGDIVLDCGAHIGTYTREALNAGAKLVVAIEPTRESVVSLKRNFAKEITEGRVIVYDKGVWDRDEILTFYVAEIDTYNSTLKPGEVKSVETKINVTTIDHIVSELNLPRVDFIKMDIEGAEQKALHGAKESIVKYKPRMAIATEHTEDIFLNAQKVSEIVKSINNGYQAECGECIINSKAYIQPSVLLFY